MTVQQLINELNKLNKNATVTLFDGNFWNDIDSVEITEDSQVVVLYNEEGYSTDNINDFKSC